MFLRRRFFSLSVGGDVCGRGCIFCHRSKGEVLVVVGR